MTSLSIDSNQRVDALVVGTVFLDVVLADLPRSPERGHEVWAGRRALCPGGIANNAVALARLGLSTCLVAALGADPAGDLVWKFLSREPNLDLGRVLRSPRVETALTVALGADDERALISHGVLDPLPVEEITPTLPVAQTCFVSLKPEPAEWVPLQRDAGAAIFAGVGFDERHGWSHEVLTQLRDVDVLVLNEVEAISYARCETVAEAAHYLGRDVPLVVVTRGGQGVYAFDSAASLEVTLPAVAVAPVDTTGAGDVFVSALMHGHLLGGSLEERLRYASLAAGLAVSGLGGASSAPRFDDLLRWHLRNESGAAREYHFLEEWARRLEAQGRQEPDLRTAPLCN